MAQIFLEAESESEITRSDHERHHQNGRDKTARGESGGKTRFTKNRQSDQRRFEFRFGKHENTDSVDGGEQQASVRSEVATPDDHDKRISGEC